MFVRQKIKPPCGKDCPDRAVGCAADCSKWSEYVRERDKEYKAREINVNVNNAITDGYRRMGGKR